MFSLLLGLLDFSVSLCDFSGFSVGFWNYSGFQLAFGNFQDYSVGFLDLFRFFSWLSELFGFQLVFWILRAMSEPICVFCLFDLISCLRSKMEKTGQAVDLEHRMRDHCNRFISLFNVAHFNLSYYVRSRIRLNTIYMFL